MRLGCSVLAVVAVFWPACEVWSASPATNALQDCVKISDAASRLACFDREVAELSTRDTSTAKPAPSTALSPVQKMGLPAARVERLEAPQGVTPQKLKTLEAHIASVSRDAAGLAVFALDNGQIWRQTEVKSDFWVKPGDPVIINTGALGSFWLSSNAHSVTRVKRQL